MIEMMVWLSGQNAKLVSTRFEEKQIWTETWGAYLEVLQGEIGNDLLDLRVWLDGL